MRAVNGLRDLEGSRVRVYTRRASARSVDARGGTAILPFRIQYGAILVLRCAQSHVAERRLSFRAESQVRTS